ncbi:MAG: alanine racemase [Bacteroidales bacterium]|nr:alanine racemase [Bacteroidales bacterium]
MLQISKPVLLIDEAKCRNNIRQMKAKADAASVLYRPHFKTHQSGLIGEWFRESGTTAITVSSLSMARYFADHGWNDITIAFPVNPLELEGICSLVEKISLNILVESVDVIGQIEQHVHGATQRIGVFIKIDVGAGRTGILMSDTASVIALASAINNSPSLLLKGLLAHAGHTYKAKGRQAIEQIVSTAVAGMNHLRKAIGNEKLILSWGDTPSCSMATNLDGFDEWRPGNFVFYDVMQYHIGSCSLDQVAVAMACPVVAVHPARNQAVIYGGAIHFSKELIRADNAFELFGYVVRINDQGWSTPLSGAWLGSLSQEHGIVNLPADVCHKLKPGDILGILPIHSCLAVSAMRNLSSVTGLAIPCMK